MSASYIQGTKALKISTENPVSYDSDTTAGNTLIVSCVDFNNNPPTGISDTLGLTWTPLFSSSPDSFESYCSGWAATTTGGADTVTVSFANADETIVLVTEYSPIGAFQSVNSFLVNLSSSDLDSNPITILNGQSAIGFFYSGGPAIESSTPVCDQGITSDIATCHSSTPGNLVWSGTLSTSEATATILALFGSSGPSAVGWSPVDCRNYGNFPNTGIIQPSGAVFYTGQTSSNPDLPPVDSNPDLPPTDSREAGAPQNSRTAPPF